MKHCESSIAGIVSWPGSLEEYITVVPGILAIIDATRSPFNVKNFWMPVFTGMTRRICRDLIAAKL